MRRWRFILGSAVLLALALTMGASASAVVLGWSRIHGPTPVGSATLHGVACESASSCVAVGQTSAGPLAEVGGGTTWRVTSTPSLVGAGGGVLFDVACASPDSCFAVGAGLDQSAFNPAPNSIGGLIERWDGSSWTIQPHPDAHVDGVYLNAVSCTSSSACIAVGTMGGNSPLPTAERWDGTSWTSLTVPAPSSPQSVLAWVSCAAATECIAVGGTGDGTNGFGTLAEQWNGTAWRILPSPTSQVFGDGLNAVSCASTSACTAVGVTSSGMLAERWNGTAWSVQKAVSPPGSEFTLNGVSCPSATVCTAVGFIVAGFPQPLAERWNGTTWSLQAMPQLIAATDIGEPAVACVSASACTYVGGWAQSGPSQTLIYQYGALACVVPNLKGETLHAATGAIGKAHCSLGRITRRYSATIKRGHVISQKPKPMLTEPGGSKIALLVSRGHKRR